MPIKSSEIARAFLKTGGLDLIGEVVRIFKKLLKKFKKEKKTEKKRGY